MRSVGQPSKVMEFSRVNVAPSVLWLKIAVLGQKHSKRLERTRQSHCYKWHRNVIQGHLNRRL